MERICQKLGKKIRITRESQGLSQEAFAERARLHRTYIGSVERGERNLSISSINKIANALGISLESLFEGIK